MLPFHKLGETKWERLGRPFPLAATDVPSRELVHRVRERFASYGLGRRLTKAREAGGGRPRPRWRKPAYDGGQIAWT